MRIDPSLVLFATIPLACASVPPPAERMASAESAIRAASEVGADRVPTAAYHQQLAREELGKARAFSKDGKNREADTMAERASSDAELALALTREEDALHGAERARDEVRETNSNAAPRP